MNIEKFSLSTQAQRAYAYQRARLGTHHVKVSGGRAVVFPTLTTVKQERANG